MKKKMEYTEEEQQLEQQQQASAQEQLAQQELLQRQAAAQQARQGMPINQDRDFMEWLFNFKEEMIAPLKHLWRGEEEINPGYWEKPKNKSDQLVIMNERGITWCTSFLGSWISPVYIVSNYDETAMNWTMRKVARVVWNSLARRYEEFALKKIDIPRVAMELISKVHAILLGARGNGYKTFFASTRHIDEVKSTTHNEPPTTGWGIFKRNKAQPAQMY